MKLPFLGDKQLYRNKEHGKIMGVCAGIADYTGAPVGLIRLMAVLSLFGLLLITLVIYFGLGFILEKKPAVVGENQATLSIDDILEEADQTLRQSEQRLRDIEGYVTSETFSIRSRFRQL